MKKRILNQVIGLGAVAGMRTMSAPALVSRYLKAYPSRKLSRSRLSFMQGKGAATIFTILAIGELIGDKLPMVPDRIEPGGLIGRGMSGALVGATLARTQGKKYATGAGIGLLSAVVSTFLSYYIRKQLTESSIVPGYMWGTVEDVVAIRSGRRLLRPKVLYIKKRIS